MMAGYESMLSESGVWEMNGHATSENTILSEAQSWLLTKTSAPIAAEILPDHSFTNLRASSISTHPNPKAKPWLLTEHSAPIASETLPARPLRILKASAPTPAAYGNHKSPAIKPNDPSPAKKVARRGSSDFTKAEKAALSSKVLLLWFRDMEVTIESAEREKVVPVLPEDSEKRRLIADYLKDLSRNRRRRTFMTPFMTELITKCYGQHTQRTGEDMASLDLDSRCKIYAEWFSPDVAKKLLEPLSKVVRPDRIMRSPHLDYIQALFVGVCDTMIMYPESGGDEEAKFLKVDPHRVHTTLRGIPKTYEGVAFPARPNFKNWLRMPWVRVPKKA